MSRPPSANAPTAAGALAPALQDALARIPAAHSWWVALSGGLDSLLLLHALARWRVANPAPPLHAIHVHHGLRPDADAWATHCAAECARLGIPLHTARVIVERGGQGVEQAARAARYHAFAEHLPEGALLLVAQHQDDQAETQLYRLVRGAGVQGLAGMPLQRPLGRGQLYRPWLHLARAQLQAEAERLGLVWIDDDSNAHLDYDRNYLRHRVLPALRERWPACASRMARAADHLRDAARLLDVLASQDLQPVRRDAHSLWLAPLRELDAARQRNLARYWLNSLGLDMPPEAEWAEHWPALLNAGEDRQPQLSGAVWQLRRYRNALYLLPLPFPQPERHARLRWSSPHARLRWAGGVLRMQRAVGGLNWPDGAILEVVARQGGERLHLQVNGPRRPLKKWLQEQAVPPWQRERLPLLKCGEDWVAVGDLWIAPAWRAAPGTEGWQLVWEADFH